MGLDAFLEINTWHKWQELFSECDFVVTSRPGSPEVAASRMVPEEVRDQFKWNAKEKVFTHSSGHKVYFTEVTNIDLSASAIRKMVREGQSIRYLLPRRAIDYIIENKLYRQ